MHLDKFVEASLTELASLTGIDKGNFSKIDGGKLVSERTINRIAEATGLEPDRVLKGLNLRRKKSCEKEQTLLAS